MDSSVLQQLNSGSIFLICGVIIAFIAVVCVIFIVRAWRAGLALGMDPVRMRRAVTSSATFSILPGIGILLGVIALSGSLGTPWPWLRLSVIGALHYETQVAEAAAEAAGLHSLSAAEMTPSAFSTIALLMSACIMWGMVLSIITLKSYSAKLKSGNPGQKQEKRSAFSGFGDIAMTAMFIGLVSAYIGSYIGTLVSGNGMLGFSGSPLPLEVAAVGAAAMACFIWISEKKHAVWIDSFSLAGSMLAAMTAAVFLANH